jgi:TonB family protein
MIDKMFGGSPEQLLTHLVLRCQTMRRPTAGGAVTRPPQPTIVNTNEPLFEFQVEDPVTAAAGSGAPRFPDLLRQAGVEGEVLVQFVVDTTGAADPTSFRVLKSTHELFSDAVRSALPTLKFNAARVGGRKVKQLVQQPFTFAINR